MYELGALSDGRCCIAFVVSVTVGNPSNSTLHSTYGNLLITLALIVDGRLSTLSKCLTHRFKIAYLCQKCASICTKKWGGSRSLWTLLTVFGASWNFFMSFLSAKDWISSTFLLSQEFCMSLSLLRTVLQMLL